MRYSGSRQGCKLNEQRRSQVRTNTERNHRARTHSHDDTIHSLLPYKLNENKNVSIDRWHLIYACLNLTKTGQNFARKLVGETGFFFGKIQMKWLKKDQTNKQPITAKKLIICLIKGWKSSLRHLHRSQPRQVSLGPYTKTHFCSAREEEK